MSHQVHPDHPILPLLSQRWSPYAFSSEEVHDTDLAALFEAARWAPSAYNEQPWRYLVTRRGLTAHPMAGLNIKLARECFQVPEEFEIVTAMAIGFYCEEAPAAEEWKEKDRRRRPRHPLSEFVFAERFSSARRFNTAEDAG